MKTAPVLVRVKHWDIAICPLAVLPGGSIAIDASKKYRDLGSVEKGAHTNEKGYYVTVWHWTDVRGAKGHASTKTEAVSDMLAANGFHEVPVEATMPDLLAGLEEGDTTP